MHRLARGELHHIAPLFEGVAETLVWSCLQGEMGAAWADDPASPGCARIVLGDFAFFAGDAENPCSPQLVRHLPPGKVRSAMILIPPDEKWAAEIEAAYAGRCKRGIRYATKKDPEAFDRHSLERFASSLPPGYGICRIGQVEYGYCWEHPWAVDFVSQFESWDDYQRRGIGFLVWHQGSPVCGASSYSVYREGIEIEIGTQETHRRKGLATACAARLMLACLDQGKYPSWDAANPASLQLAKKLGYQAGEPYPVYFVERA